MQNTYMNIYLNMDLFKKNLILIKKKLKFRILRNKNSKKGNLKIAKTL